jgi:outer membrane immunogenic protein
LINFICHWGVQMNKLLTASVALLALGLSAPAKAADMPVKYVAPTVFTWTGCYVGAQIGYKWGRSRHTSTGALNGTPNATGGYDFGPSFNLDGVIGGGEAGCNWQVGSWVYGIEVDGSWSTAEGQSTHVNYGAVGFFSPFYVDKTSERWLMTARGRIGYAADKWLWYVTAGAAWTGVDINVSNPANPAVPALTQFAIERHNKTGWVVGFGTEYALLGGWSVKSEWLYANFGTIHAFDFTPGCTLAVDCGARDVKLYEFVWRVGMNYRFDWASWGKGKAPAVVAKY